MGNCFRGQQSASVTAALTKTQDDKRENVDQTALHKTQQQETLTKIASNWKEDTQAIWKRNFRLLAVHTDLPRLGKHMEVIVDEVKVCGPFEGSQTNEEVVLTILRNMAKALDGQDLADKIEREYPNYIGKGDFSQHLLQFLDQVITEDTRTMRVLKACQQKIIFPGFYSVKHVLDADYPFKDARGTWRVRVGISRGTGVWVEHRKAALAVASIGQSGPPEFSFDWLLRLTFDATLNAMTDVQMVVGGLTTANGLVPQYAAKIVAAFTTHYPNATSPTHLQSESLEQHTTKQIAATQQDAASSQDTKPQQGAQTLPESKSEPDDKQPHDTQPLLEHHAQDKAPDQPAEASLQHTPHVDDAEPKDQSIKEPPTPEQPKQDQPSQDQPTQDQLDQPTQDNSQQQAQLVVPATIPLSSSTEKLITTDTSPSTG